MITFKELLSKKLEELVRLAILDDIAAVLKLWPLWLSIGIVAIIYMMMTVRDNHE